MSGAKTTKASEAKASMSEPNPAESPSPPFQINLPVARTKLKASEAKRTNASELDKKLLVTLREDIQELKEVQAKLGKKLDKVLAGMETLQKGLQYVVDHVGE